MYYTFLSDTLISNKFIYSDNRRITVSLSYFTLSLARSETTHTCCWFSGNFRLHPECGCNYTELDTAGGIPMSTREYSMIECSSLIVLITLLRYFTLFAVT